MSRMDLRGSAATLRQAADQTCDLTPSQFTDTGPTSASTDVPLTPGACQGSHNNTSFQISDMTRPGKMDAISESVSRQTPYYEDTEAVEMMKPWDGDGVFGIIIQGYQPFVFHVLASLPSHLSQTEEILSLEGTAILHNACFSPVEVS